MELTFLALCSKAFKESGLTGAGPTAVTGQTGMNDRFVDWVQEAHEEVQQRFSNWNFNWTQGTFALAIGADTYDPTVAVPTGFGITGGVKRWVRDGAYSYVTANGVNSRLFMTYLEWEQFRTLTIPVLRGQAMYFTERPDKSIQFSPMPLQAMTAVMEYWMNPQVLVLPTDIPRMPKEYHMAIVWNAVMRYSSYNKDWSRYDSAQGEYDQVMAAAMETEQSAWTMGGALA